MHTRFYNHIITILYRYNVCLFLQIEPLYIHVWLCYRIIDVNIFYLDIDISFYDSHSLQVPLIKCLWFFEIFHIKKIITHSLINKYFVIHIQYACNHMYIQQKYLESKRYAIQWDKKYFLIFHFNVNHALYEIRYDSIPIVAYSPKMKETSEVCFGYCKKNIEAYVLQVHDKIKNSEIQIIIQTKWENGIAKYSKVTT